MEGSSLLIDGVTETVKHEIKKQEVGFLGFGGFIGTTYDFFSNKRYLLKKS